MRARIATFVLAVLLASCSSAPPAPEGVQDRSNRAADYLKFGQKAFQQAQYDQALAFYQIALDLNTAVDFEPGMAVSWNSVAAAQTALGKIAEAKESLNQAEAMAKLTKNPTHPSGRGQQGSGRPRFGRQRQRQDSAHFASAFP